MTTSLWVRYTLVTLVFLMLAAILTWPHVRLLGSSVLGGGGDVTSGIRYLWALEQQGGNPFTTERDVLLGSPEGTPALRAVNVGNMLFVGSVWILGHLFGWVVAMNVYNLAGLVLAGTAAFVLLDRLKLGLAAAAFGSYVFAFNPNHLEKAMGHAPLAATWILPVVLFALVAKRARPNLGRSLAVGALVGAAFYLNSYLGLFALWLAGVFCLVELVVRPEGASLYSILRSYYFAAVAGTVSLAPLAISLYYDRTAVSSFANERNAVLAGGYAAPELYLLPSPRHPWLGGPMESWLETHLSWEFTMFFGYTTLALAVAGVVIAIVRHRRGVLGRESAALVTFAVLLTLTSLWASAPPTVSFLGLDLPTPAYVMREATTLFRVFSRFGVLVGLGLILLAAYALANLPRRPVGAVAATLALAAVAFEVYVPSPALVRIQDVRTPISVADLAESGSGRPEILSLADPPSYLQWLEQRPTGLVVDYPTPTNTKGRWAWMDTFFQYYHRDPLWFANGRDDRIDVQAYVADLGRARVPDVLAGSGVDYVVVHADRYRELGQRLPRAECGLERIGTFPEDDVTIYRVMAAGKSGFVSRGGGFYDRADGKVWPEVKGFRWMAEEGRVLVFAPDDQEIYLAGVALSLNRPRRLDILDQTGATVGAWEILQFETSFRIALRVHRGVNTLTFRSTPGAERRGSGGKGSDTRRVSIALAGLTSTPTDPAVAAEAAKAGLCSDAAAGSASG